MQGKGLIKFFLVLMIIVSAIQYLFLIPTNKIENSADKYAEEVASSIEDEAQKIAAGKRARIEYLDSVSSENVFSIPMIKSYTYDELKQQQLALGLDLKGGMSAVLQVDLTELLVALSNDSNDPNFRLALSNANESLKTSSSDFITLFASEYQQIEDAKPLSRIFLRNEAMRDDIDAESPNGVVVNVLRQKANQTVQLTFDRLKKRIDKLGVSQPNVFLDAARDLIIVEMPGLENPARARNFLEASAKLEFWETYRFNDPGIFEAFNTANDRLKKEAALDDTPVAVDDEPQMEYVITAYDSLGNPSDSALQAVDQPEILDLNAGPLFTMFNLNGTTAAGGGYAAAVMGTAEKNKRSAVIRLLNQPEIKIGRA